MNLEYSILWFDDSKAYLDSVDLEPIREDIVSWGFIPKFVPVYTADEFNSHTPFDQYDLIVVDFTLEGMPGGAEFIAKVREQQVYTEIIFYSANPISELWKSIGERQLEGIFVSNRNGVGQKIIRVARQSVRKVLDLENMRGIVMSEVGDLDALLEKIFIKAIEGIPKEKKDDVFKRFHENVDAQAKEFQAALSGFKAAPSIDALMKLCDSDKRWQNFMRVRKHHEVLKEKKFGDYPTEILWPRNCLAHGRPDRQGDGTYVFRFHEKDYKFSDDVGKSLRQKILEYKGAFQEIAELLA